MKRRSPAGSLTLPERPWRCYERRAAWSGGTQPLSAGSVSCVHTRPPSLRGLRLFQSSPQPCDRSRAARAAAHVARPPRAGARPVAHCCRARDSGRAISKEHIMHRGRQKLYVGRRGKRGQARTRDAFSAGSFWAHTPALSHSIDDRRQTTPDEDDDAHAVAHGHGHGDDGAGRGVRDDDDDDDGGRARQAHQVQHILGRFMHGSACGSLDHHRCARWSVHLRGRCVRRKVVGEFTLVMRTLKVDHTDAVNQSSLTARTALLALFSRMTVRAPLQHKHLLINACPPLTTADPGGSTRAGPTTRTTWRLSKSTRTTRRVKLSRSTVG